MTRLGIKNWSNFQHYKDRSPPWIKLHKSLLDDFEYQRLPIASKALAPMLWLLASENIDGSFDGDPERIAFRLRWPVSEIVLGIKPLIKDGFVLLVEGVLADCYHDAVPETETEAYKPETKTEADRPAKSAPEANPPVSPAAPPRRADSSQGKRLPADWKLPKAWGEWAMEDNPALTAEDVRKEGEKFRNHWIAKAGKDARKIDWKATWANWIRSDYVKPSGALPAGLSEKWFLSGKGIEAKGLELGIVMGDGELFPNYKNRVYAAANITEEMVRNARADAPRHV